MSLLTRHPRLGAYLAALVVYGLAIVLAFHAVVFHPGSRIMAGFGDGTTTLRYIWAASVEHHNPLLNFTRDTLTGAPEGIAQAPAIALGNGGLEVAFVMALRGPLGLVGAWNAELLLVGFLATALAMFAFLRRLGCSFLASLIGGYAFAFSPYALERAYVGHAAYVENWVFVLAAVALLRLRERRSLGSAVVVGGAIALACYVSTDQGVLAGLMTLVFLAVELARLRDRREQIRTGALGGLAYLVALAALTPLLVLYVQERVTVRQQTQFPLNEYYQFAGSLPAYFLPDPTNPLFHWLRGIHPPDLTNQTLFFGYLTLVLALCAVVLLAHGDRWLGANAARRWSVIFLTALAAVAFIVSLPPTYGIDQITIAMPSDLIRVSSFPMRIYSRFGVLAGFAVVTLAALALSTLAGRPGRRWRLLTPLAVVVIFLELLPGNVQAVATNVRPSWAVWLASQPRGIVASYPIAYGQGRRDTARGRRQLVPGARRRSGLRDLPDRLLLLAGRAFAHRGDQDHRARPHRPAHRRGARDRGRPLRRRPRRHLPRRRRPHPEARPPSLHVASTLRERGHLRRASAEARHLARARSQLEHPCRAPGVRHTDPRLRRRLQQPRAVQRNDEPLDDPGRPTRARRTPARR